MSSARKALRLMTHINIGATLALVAWVVTSVVSRGGG